MPDEHIFLSFIIFCAIVSFIEAGLSNVRIVVKFDHDGSLLDVGKSADKVIYNVGDILILSCDGPDIKSKDIFYGLVYEKDGINLKIPKEGSYENNSFTYSIQTYDFDDKSKVYCEVETFNKSIAAFEFFDCSTPVTLIMKSDNHLNDPIPEVSYIESNTVTHTCSEPDNCLIVMTDGTQRYCKGRKFDLAPSDTGSIMMCSEIRTLRKNGISYTRIIYNQTKLTYTTKVSSEKLDDGGTGEGASSPQLSGLSSIQIGIVVGVVTIICIGLVAGLVLYKCKRNIPNVEPSPNQDTNNDSCSTQLIYAELALSQAPRSDYSNLRSSEETPYAEIGGFIARMPKVNDESPYAEIIARK